ncbi:MAG: hypothetical protein ACLUEV_12390 [Alistipes sp.]
MAEYLTSYYGSRYRTGRCPDARVPRLGARRSLPFRAGVPMKVYAGLFNGAGRTTEWGQKVNVIGV